MLALYAIGHRSMMSACQCKFRHSLSEHIKGVPIVTTAVK